MADRRHHHPRAPGLNGVDIARQLDHSGSKVMVVEDGASSAGAVAVLDVSDLRRDFLAVAATPYTDPAALALVIYTSGTTGVPKGTAQSSLDT